MNKYIKGLQKHFAFIMVAIVALGCVTCGSNSSNYSGRYDNGDNMEKVIKKYFDKSEWHYQMHKNGDSITTFKLGFQGKNEIVEIGVDIFKREAFYQIDGHSQTTAVAEDKIDRGLVAVNDYNMRATVVSACINSFGTVIFWLGRSTAYDTFSENAFAEDLNLVFTAIDEETSHICGQTSSE